LVDKERVVSAIAAKPARHVEFGVMVVMTFVVKTPLCRFTMTAP